MLLATIIFFVFALLATIGAYLIGRQRSAAFGALLAVLSILFFAALAVGVVFLLRSAPHV